MPAPTKEQIEQLWAIHNGDERRRENLLRAYGFDSTRSWVSPDGYRLSDRIWRARKAVRDQIDQVLREAIANGTDALEVADILEQYLNPDLAPVRNALGRLIRKQKPVIVTRAPGRGGMGSFSARRLARTEITRAHGQATIETAKRTPFAVGVKWSLSGRHPKSDPCDENAHRNNGLGPGVYKPDDVPSYPNHAMCLCNLSTATEDDVDSVVRQLREQYNLGTVEAAVEDTVPSFTTTADAAKWANANLQTPVDGIKGTDLGLVRDALRTVQEIEGRTGGAIPATIRFGGVKGQSYGQFDHDAGTVNLRKRYESDLEARRRADNVEWIKRIGGDVPFHATTDLRGLIYHEVAHAYDAGFVYRRRLAALPLETRRELLKVSGYSGEDFIYGRLDRIPPLSEAWAEAFAAVGTNSDRAAFVPLEVRDMIEEILKQ